VSTGLYNNLHIKQYTLKLIISRDKDYLSVLKNLDQLIRVPVIISFKVLLAALCTAHSLSVDGGKMQEKMRANAGRSAPSRNDRTRLADHLAG